ncbi:MAG: tetratricopeptide repeat protein, partial [Pseudomonadota bacterium]
TEPREAPSAADIEEELFAGDDAPAKMTAREKIIAAARARHERLAREREESGQTELIDEAPVAPEDEIIAESALHAGPVDADGQNRRLGVPLVVLLGVILLGAILIGAFLMTRGGGEDTAEVPQAATTGAVTETAGQPADSALATPPPDGAILYAQGKDVLATATTSEEYTQGFNLMREAAIFGHIPARYRLGELYFAGIGTQQDLRSAKTWFTEAAMDGNAAAMHRLGSLAIDSSFEGQNFDDAMEWFGRAADLGVIDSMYNLGYLYDPSTVGYLPAERQSAEEAYFWYSIAAREGDPVAPGDAAAVAATLSAQQVETIDARVRAWTARPYDPRVNDGLQVVG